MTPTWLTISLAVLTLLGTLSGALGAQLIASKRARDLAKGEQAARREEQTYQDRREVYTKLLVACGLIRPAALAAGGPADAEAVLSGLRDAGITVELTSPELTDAIESLLASAERTASLASREGPSRPATVEAHTEYQTAVSDLRTRMLDHLNR
ncbi:hypothetical protein [Amycolatopsis sp. NPDC054798]